MPQLRLVGWRAPDHHGLLERGVLIMCAEMLRRGRTKDDCSHLSYCQSLNLIKNEDHAIPVNLHRPTESSIVANAEIRLQRNALLNRLPRVEKPMLLCIKLNAQRLQQNDSKTLLETCRVNTL